MVTDGPHGRRDRLNPQEIFPSTGEPEAGFSRQLFDAERGEVLRERLARIRAEARRLAEAEHPELFRRKAEEPDRGVSEGEKPPPRLTLHVSGVTVGVQPAEDTDVEKVEQLAAGCYSNRITVSVGEKMEDTGQGLVPRVGVGFFGNRVSLLRLRPRTPEGAAFLRRLQPGIHAGGVVWIEKGGKP